MGNSFDIAEEIVNELQRYSNEIVRRVNISSEKCAKELCAEIKKTSPKKTGGYGKGWTVKKANLSKYALGRLVVHNKTKYQLTHLLEYGHAVKGGTKRVGAAPHIFIAKEKAVQNFVQEVEKAIQEAGNG